jgi:hypothetical protein
LLRAAGFALVAVVVVVTWEVCVLFGAVAIFVIIFAFLWYVDYLNTRRAPGTPRLKR